jgi:hypothetical protein
MIKKIEQMEERVVVLEGIIDRTYGNIADYQWILNDEVKNENYANVKHYANELIKCEKIVKKAEIELEKISKKLYRIEKILK